MSDNIEEEDFEEQELADITIHVVVGGVSLTEDEFEQYLQAFEEAMEIESSCYNVDVSDDHPDKV